MDSYKNFRSNYLSKNKQAEAAQAQQVQQFDQQFKYGQVPGFGVEEPLKKQKPKFVALDMRKPGGMSITELQNEERKGRFNHLQANR